MVSFKRCPYTQTECPTPYEQFSEACKQCLRDKMVGTREMPMITPAMAERMAKNGGSITPI